MAFTLTPTPVFRAFDTNGAPLAGGKLYSYAAGTTTPLATYTDSTGGTPNTNPIILDAYGEAAVWLGSSAYKFNLTDANGVQQPDYPVNNVIRYASSAEVTAVLTSLASEVYASQGAGLIGYRYASGATGRTLESKLQENLSVLDYGAVGDLVANDTNAITNAIATGKKVYFTEPASGYISGAQTITTQGQRLVGDGINTIIQALNATINQFTFQADYCEVEWLRLNGVATDSTNSTFAIYTSSSNAAQFLKVNNVSCNGADSGHGWNNFAKFDDNCNYGKVIDCIAERLWGTSSGHGYGVLAGNAKNILVDGFIYLGSSGRGRHAIYFSAGCSYSKCTNFYFDSCNFEAISQQALGGQPSCIGNIYSNGTILNADVSATSASGGIYIGGHSNGTKLIGIFISGSNGKGIALDGTGVTDLADTDIDCCSIYNSATIGIDIISAARTKLTGVRVFESSQASAGVSSNIRLTSDGVTPTIDTLLSGCHSSGATHAAYALELNATTPTPSRTKAMGNFLPTCNAGSVLANGIELELDGGIRYVGTLTGGTIANNASISQTFTGITGVVTGDYADAALASDDKGCSVYARGTSSGSVNVTVTNDTGSSQTVASQTINIVVWKYNP